MTEHLDSSEIALLHLAKTIVAEASSQLVPSKKPNYNYLGDDLDAEKLMLIDEVVHRHHKPADMSVYVESQLSELAFWRWVAFEGYANQDPRSFPWFQQVLMTESYLKTGWTLSELSDSSIVEIGCGPLGMVEFLPGKYKVGYDPLNDHYAKLFRHARTGGVQHTSDMNHLLETGRDSFDFGICYNVLDHTTEPWELLDSYMSLLRPEGRFLFQVNTVKEDEPRPESHARLHPSPLTADTICKWLDDYSRDYRTLHDEQPSELNEYSFMAWGQKNSCPRTVNE